MEIKDIHGNILINALVTESAVKIEELMKQDSITLSWKAITADELPLGAYIVYNGVKYSLLAPYRPRQIDEATYEYAPVFHHPVMRWQHLPFFFYSNGTKETDWSLTDNPANFMDAVCEAISQETGENWSYSIASNLSASASLSFSNTDIFSALNSIASAFETEWWFDYANKELHLSKASKGSAVILEVGKNISVPSATESKEGYATRFYVFGSTRNIDQQYSGSNVNSIVNRRLTLDPAKYPNGYIDIRQGLTNEEVLVKTLVFDDIYPRSSLTISDVRVRLMWRLDDNNQKVQIGTDSEGTPVYDQYAIWYFKIPSLSFSKDSIISGKALSVHFNSGSLSGREFELTYHEDTKELENSDGVNFTVEAGDFEINFIEEGTFIIPAITGLIPTEGNSVTLFNINMPQEYVASAYNDLEDAAKVVISEQSADFSNYSFESNPVEFFNNNPNLSIGRNVSFISGDYAYSTRVIKLETQLDRPYEQKITIGNQKIKGNTQELKEEVVNVNQNVDLLASINETTNAFQQSLQRTQKLMQEYMSIALFERINVGTEEEPKYAIKPVKFKDKEVGIVSDTFITAGGRKSENEDEPQGSATTLGGLVNVEDNVDAIYDKVQVLVKLANATHFTLADYNAVAGLDEKQLKEYLDKNAYLNKTEADKLYATLTQFNALKTKIDTFLDSENLNGTIDRWKEVESFLLGYTDQQTLAELFNAKADKTALDNLSTVVSSKADQSSVDSLSNTVSNKADKSDVSNLSNTVNGIQSSVSGLSNGISQNTQDIATNAAAVVALGIENTKLSNAIDTLSDNVDDLSTEVTRVSNQLGDKLDKDDISGLSTTVENLRIDVENHTENIQDLNANLTDHITAYNKHIQDYNNFKENVTNGIDELLDMFEWQTVNGVKSIKAKAGLWSDSFITAGDYNSENGGGAAYDRLDNWSDYNANSGAVLSAKLGYGLKVEIENLKAVDHFNETKLNNYLVKNNYLTKVNADSYYASIGTVAALDTKVTDIDNRLKVIEGYWGEDTTLNALYPKKDRGIYSISFITAGGAKADSGSGGGLDYFEVVIPNMGTFGLGSNGKVQLPSYPEMLPASDVYAWAKAANKPTYTKAEVGLGNVQNVAVYTRELGVNGTNWTFASTYYTTDGKSTSIYAPTSAGTAGQYLVSNGAGAPYWQTINPYDANTSRTANTVLAAPNGSNGSATFRKLVSADIPSLDWSKITSGKPTTISGYGITDAITTANIANQSVASAKKLTNSRTLWGQSFNGESNISGALSEVYNITPDSAHTYSCGTSNSPWNIVHTRYIDTYTGYDLRFRTGGTEQMRITAASGCLILGGSSASENSSYKLDVRGTFRATGNINADSNIVAGADVYGDYFLIKNRNSNPYYKLTDGSYSVYVQLLTDGSMALGSISSYSLTVSSNGNTRVNGNLLVTGESTAGAASDRRLKDNIQSMTDAQATRVLKSLNPVTFQWNALASQLGSHNGYSDGFIADEYEALIPNSGRSIWIHYRAIDYTRVSSYLVKGWQNHETRLEAAERRIKELEIELAQYRRA